MTVILRASALVARRWKNGGGITREIAAGPQGASLEDFAWRLSLAEVSADGAFSSFDGVDRVLVLLDGAGMTLQGEVACTLNRPLEMTRFAGEASIHATLADGPTRDFNVMTRRGRARASVSAHTASHGWTAEHGITFIHCARGRVDVAIAQKERVELSTGDTLRIDGAKLHIACENGNDAAWLHIGIDMTEGETP